MIGAVKAYMGVCRDCSNRDQVSTNDWYNAAVPRCSICGGMLDRAKAVVKQRAIVRYRKRTGNPKHSRVDHEGNAERNLERGYAARYGNPCEWLGASLATACERTPTPR